MRGNVLGDIRAEQDKSMLDTAFWESADYKSLLESYDRPIIVGRRGTGKSALAYRLSKHWDSKPKTLVLSISPEEEQVIGLRDIFDQFGEKYLHIKAGTKMAWRYAIYMEILVELGNHYKFKSNLDLSQVRDHYTSWGSRRQSISTKIRKKLKSVLNESDSPQSRIADLSDNLELDLLEEVLLEALDKSDVQFVVFADRLDEGYSPDNLGVGIIDGFIQASIDIKSKMYEKIVAFAFVRDNIYRAISKLDPDFTRNIEGQTLRLHWDEYNLFNLVCFRLKSAFKCEHENSIRIWNQYAAKELKGKEGFRLALKLTLYRPRDILVLLNEAFLKANSNNRRQIVLEDIEYTAKTISMNRLNDLHKEYEYIFPSIEEFTKSFYGQKSEMAVSEVEPLIGLILEQDRFEKEKQQDIFLFGDFRQVLQRLYSVGFIGVHNEQSASFVFCHDGKDPDKEFTNETRILVHPCYWLALAIGKSGISLEEAEEIHDEYEIEVTSESKGIRNKRIETLIQELGEIKEGKDGAYDFESWCVNAIKIIFAGTLCNVEAHPNKNSLQQRDVVATNLEESKFWKRVIKDYKTRQVIFEIKNYKDLSAAEYRQINSYLCNDYGAFAFIVTRAINNNLEKGRELNWARELYSEHKKIVVILSYKFLEKHLKKLRNPRKHNALDKELNSLLDTYVRRYFPNKSR
ncbi:P-loop ATPase, Sll1717 family [Sessilibacter corallicola]|uniref:P-loop ATPase, Sll1717 family n=1 Tax=Sessilibacter corallicola TaxID=2904075 RepID=UPI003D9C6E59